MAEVAIRRREARVTELGLDEVHRLALGCKLRRVRVAQAVRVDTLLDPCLFRNPREERSDVGGLERSALEGAEEGLSPGEADALPALEPASEDGEGSGVKPNGAATIALPMENGDRPAGSVDVLREERKHLSNAKSAAVKTDDQGPVAEARRGSARAGADEGARLLRRQDLGRVALTCVSW